MKQINTENNPRIYVGTYGKYNSGSIFGKWFDLTEYKNLKEFYNALKDYHKNEHDPEFMFQDWENIPSCLIGESWIHEEIYDYIEEIQNGNICYEVFNDFLSYYYTFDFDSIYEAIKKAQERFRGCFNSLKEYAEEELDESVKAFELFNGVELPDSIKRNLDYEGYKIDLEHLGVRFTENGNVFDHSY